MHATVKVSIAYTESGIWSLKEHYLVKADEVELATDVDPLWTDAEDAQFSEPSLGVHNACGHGCW